MRVVVMCCEVQWSVVWRGIDMSLQNKHSNEKKHNENKDSSRGKRIGKDILYMYYSFVLDFDYFHMIQSPNCSLFFILFFYVFQFFFFFFLFSFWSKSDIQFFLQTFWFLSMLSYEQFWLQWLDSFTSMYKTFWFLFWYFFKLIAFKELTFLFKIQTSHMSPQCNFFFFFFFSSIHSCCT